MARKPNYGFERRQKDIKKQAKKQAKLAKKHGAEDDGEEETAAPPEASPWDRLMQPPAGDDSQEG